MVLDRCTEGFSRILVEAQRDRDPTWVSNSKGTLRRWVSKRSSISCTGWDTPGLVVSVEGKHYGWSQGDWELRPDQGLWG